MRATSAPFVDLVRRMELCVNVAMLAALGVLTISCQDANQPSAVAPSADVLVIAPAIDGVKLGSTNTLAAVILSSNGTRRPVIASWSSDAPDVAVIQPDGHVYGARLGGTTIRASYQALSASLPLRVVPDYAGLWAGWYQVTGCVRLSGAGPNVCSFVLGSQLALQTTLTQEGARLSGTLKLFDNTGGMVVETGPVDGVIDANDSLVLSGTTLTTDPGEPSRTTLSEWSTALAGDGGSMVGRFIQNQNFQNFWGPQQIKQTCELVSFQRSKS
jgi:hypothetical protein